MAKKILSSSWFIFTAIYLAVFAILINSPMPVESDRAQEYTQYLSIIENNGAFMFDGGLVNSSLFATWLPARIQLLVNLENPEIVFNLPPCLLFALMPPFIFLITKKYYGVILSILVSVLPLSYFYFAYYANMGRVSIVWGFSAGLTWALISRKYIWAIVFGSLVVLSHYGTSYLTIIALGGTIIISLIYFIFINYRYEARKELKYNSIILVILLVMTYSWYNLVAPGAGQIVKGFIADSMLMSSTTLEYPTILNPESDNAAIKFKENVENGNKYKNLFMIESRDAVVQSAFGKTWGYMNTPQRIEFIISWLMVAIISLGLLIAVKEKVFGVLHTSLAVTMYGLIVLAVLIPHISVYYGVVRVYFTTLPVIAPCFVVATNFISEKVKINKYILPSIIIIVHYLAVSGILHSWFGIIK